MVSHGLTSYLLLWAKVLIGLDLPVILFLLSFGAPNLFETTGFHFIIYI